MYLPSDDLLLHVFCDQRRLIGVSKKEFTEKVKTHLLISLPKGGSVKIEMVDSKDYQNIQIADWIVGGIASYLNKKPLGERIYGLLKNNIVGEGKEMFKDYWEKMISSDTPEDEKKQIEKDLLEYCKMDTWAMVKIYQCLKKVISN